MAPRNHTVCLLSGAVLMLLFAAAAAAQASCAPAKFPAGRSFQRCAALPVLGASLYWTYHPSNGTAELAFRAPQRASGWVAWGINTDRPSSMAGSSVFLASPGAGGAVSVLMTYLESTSPSLTNGTLNLDVPVAPVAEYATGAYTIYVTVALPGNNTVQNTVWQAGPLSGGQIAAHPMSGPNLQSTMKLDFLSGGTGTGATNSMVQQRSPPVMTGYPPMRP
ncbi:unnamed protein product [Urochloa decumbens]|uniref:DOMON domain-containing protein n=1 Tax=Urochloa decumbens TaxID=240449 RepID=A0ABC8X7X2_9POAL